VTVVGDLRQGVFASTASGALQGIEVDRDPDNNQADLISSGPVYRTYLIAVVR